MDYTDHAKEIETLLSQLTLEEKSDMVHGTALFHTGGVPRLGIPPLVTSDGPNGVRADYRDDLWEQIGLPYDAVTYLPANTALAATWNPALAFEDGQVLGREARGRGKDVILAPGINVIRDPLCGRNYEYLSEDPYLIARMAVPLIQGIQSEGAAACVKHFAMNNQETRRNDVNVEADDRALREIYLPGFRAAVTEAGALTIMGAYNRFRGAFCCHSGLLLQDILRKEWGFDGVVISDWSAVHDTKAAAENGLDIEMGVKYNFDDYYFARPLVESVRRGEIDEAVIDEKVRNILRLMFRLGMFSDNRPAGAYNLPEHREAAYRAALEAPVLCKNDGLLPVDPKTVKKVLVVGENAVRLQQNPQVDGDSGEIKALYEITPLCGVKMRLGGGAEVRFARGYSKDAGADEAQKLADEAAAAAKEADLVLYFGGLSRSNDHEGGDRPDMKLPYGQDALIARLLDANPKTVLTLIAGSPVDMTPFIGRASAVLHGFYAGMENGRALAALLFGDANPSGKLAFTIPKAAEDAPARRLGEFPGGDDVRYGEGILVGYRYYDTCGVEPLFCFGHGLSYTTFSYANLTVEPLEAAGFSFRVRVDVTNTGEVAGAEVVQLYISDPLRRFGRPEKELKGFAKLFLKPGETKTAEMTLDRTSFAYYDTESDEWVAAAGRYELLTGSSSRDIRVKGAAELSESIRFR